MEYNEQQQIRIKKLDKIKELIDGYSYNFKRPSNTSDSLRLEYSTISKEDLQLQTTQISLLGRVHTFRKQGKALFITIKDETGTFQIYLREDILSELDWTLINLVDLGDILYFEGTIMKTNLGELTLRAQKIIFITKSINPLPEKYHGLQDVEEIYRHRYLDLIVNDESKAKFKLRSQIIREIRAFLDSNGFIEFETPYFHPILGGASAKPFVTFHNSLGQNFFLRVAPELYLKRLIIGGFNKVYEIGKSFRNEGISIKHNPEFTSIETYEAFADFNDAIKLTENIFQHLSSVILKTTEIKYEDFAISLKTPFKQIEMNEIIKNICKIDFEKISFEQAKELAQKNQIKLENHFTSKGYIMNAFFEHFVEETLIQPTFITGYPVEVSPLSKQRKNNKSLTDRFELFIGGREYANGFSELNESDIQYERFLEQLKEKELGNDESSGMDMDYIEALQYGLPPTAGLGIGIDRLIMLLTNSSSIRDILLFPTLKTKK